jgi:hypothetical protein
MRLSTLNLLMVLAAAAIGICRALRSARQESSEEGPVGALPPTLERVVAQLDATTRAAFYAEYDRRRRRTSIAYLTWIVGWHYIYLRKIRVQIGFSLAVLAVVGSLWWVVDFFRIPSIVRGVNEQHAREVVRTLDRGEAGAVVPESAGGPSPSEPPERRWRQPRSSRS